MGQTLFNAFGEVSLAPCDEAVVTAVADIDYIVFTLIRGTNFADDPRPFTDDVGPDAAGYASVEEADAPLRIDGW